MAPGKEDGAQPPTRRRFQKGLQICFLDNTSCGLMPGNGASPAVCQRALPLQGSSLLPPYGLPPKAQSSQPYIPMKPGPMAPYPVLPKQKRLPLGKESLKDVCSEHSQEGPERINAARCPRALKTQPFPWAVLSLAICINSMFSLTASCSLPAF